MNMFLLETSSSSGGSSLYMMLIYIVVIFGAMYFFAIRPQRREQKRMNQLLRSMEVGDVVVTTGGFYGIIISISGDDCIVEFGNNKNCRIPMRKSAIAEVEKASDGIASNTSTSEENGNSASSSKEGKAKIKK